MNFSYIPGRQWEARNMAALRSVISRVPCFESLARVAVARQEHIVKTQTLNGFRASAKAPLYVAGPTPTVNVKVNSALCSGLVFTRSSISASPSQSRIAPAVTPPRISGHSVKFDLPPILSQMSLEMPTSKVTLLNTHIMPKTIKIEAPHAGPIIEKLAWNTPQRRRHMKKHRLRKWRKKFRSQIDRVRLIRNRKKERDFLAAVLTKIVAAENFDPKVYVAEKLREAYEPYEERQKLPRPLPWQFKPVLDDKNRSS